MGLVEGEQRRWNRVVRLVAWALGLLVPMVAQGVALGIAAAFGERVRPKVTPWQKLTPSAPHYDPSDDLVRSE